MDEHVGAYLLVQFEMHTISCFSGRMLHMDTYKEEDFT